MAADSVRTLQDFPQAVDPRVETIQRIATRIWFERPDLQTAYATLLNPEYWIWLAWHGLEEYAELKAVWFASPPAWLLERCAGVGASERDFVRSGAVDWRRQLAALQRGGVRLEGSSILELGCGAGRVLRYFSRYSAGTMFTGADSDSEAVDWCRRELGFAEFVALPSRAPSPLRAASFDAVLVPTWLEHLEPTEAVAWVEECARLLRPGGVLVACYLGACAVQRWLSADAPSTNPTPHELRRELARLRDEGALHFPAPPPESAWPENAAWVRTADLAALGSCFLTREYVERAWTRRFSVIELLEAPDGWQDYAILRRR